MVRFYSVTDGTRHTSSLRHLLLREIFLENMITKELMGRRLRIGDNFTFYLSAGSN
jgi:hypothetical protein